MRTPSLRDTRDWLLNWPVPLREVIAEFSMLYGEDYANHVLKIHIAAAGRGDIDAYQQL